MLVGQLALLEKQNAKKDLLKRHELETRKLETATRAEEFRQYTKRQQQVLVQFNEFLDKHGSTSIVVHETPPVEYQGVEDNATSHTHRNGQVPTRVSTKLEYTEKVYMIHSDSIQIYPELAEQHSDLTYFGVVYKTHKSTSKTITHHDDKVDEPVLSDEIIDFGIRYFGVDKQGDVIEIITYATDEVGLNTRRIQHNGDDTLARYPRDNNTLAILERDIKSLDF